MGTKSIFGVRSDEGEIVSIPFDELPMTMKMALRGARKEFDYNGEVRPTLVTRKGDHGDILLLPSCEKCIKELPLLIMDLVAGGVEDYALVLEADTLEGDMTEEDWRILERIEKEEKELKEHPKSCHVVHIEYASISASFVASAKIDREKKALDDFVIRTHVRSEGPFANLFHKGMRQNKDKN